MKTRRIPFVFVLSCFCATSAGAANNLPAGNHFKADYADLPVSFEANLGQADAAVEFLAHGQNGNLLLTGSEACLTLQNYGGENVPRVLRLKLSGANPNPILEGLNPLAGKANYILGNDPKHWRTDVPTFARVKYHDVYPGVDLVYYGNQQELEYDFVVQPGADPNDITLEFAGADKISVDADGDLLLCLGAKTVRQHKPVVYQEIVGTRKMLSGNYVLHSGMQVGFEIAGYDRTQPLIIDPVLAFSATFGGSGMNQALGVAVDTNDNVYVAGVTTSGDFPTINPLQTNKLGSHAAFVVKFNKNGAMVYSTFLGGGVLNDQTTTSTSAQGIAVDANGDAFVTGYTTATNFPVKNALQPKKAALSYSGRNAFVTELNPAGNGLVYSTYLGGSNTDTATGIALDMNNNVIITGYTSSTNFPTVHAAQPVYGGNGDGFVAKLSADGSTLVYSTFLGGSSYENSDTSTGVATPIGAVAVDFNGNACVTGQTYSTNFPVLNAFQPTNATAFYGSYFAAFVTKLDPAGNLVYSTYFGGKYGDTGRAIGVDFPGNVYFAGNSAHGDLPTTNAFQSSIGGSGANSIGDGFVAALDATGTNLIYCTYLGGSGDDQVNGMAVRPNDGTVAVSGFTESPNFPTLSAVQPAGNQGLFKSANAGNSWNLSNAGLGSAVIYSIQVDPFNASTIYALTQGGCFKSTDGGSTWTAASSGLGSASPTGAGAGLLALDPQHPGTLYAGCSSGVFKSTNSAVSWAMIGTGLPAFPSIISMAMDPSAPANLYVGTYFNGLYKSTDGGVTWNVATNGLTVSQVQALVVDPNSSSNVYAGAGGFTFSVSVFKSTNGGASWNLLGGGLPGGAVQQLTAGSGNIYAVIGGAFSSNPSLVVSTNGGQSWKTLLSGAGLHFNAVAIGPPATPILTITGSSNSDNISWPALFNGYFLQSTPSLNPANWQNVAQSPTTNNGNLVVNFPRSGPQEYYRLVLTNGTGITVAALPSKSPSGPTPELPSGMSGLPPTLYLCTDSASGQGILKSMDGGAIWMPSGLFGDTVNAICVNPVNPATVYAGLNGGRDGFVCSLMPNGQPYTCTYFGGSGLDQCTAIAMDPGTTLFCVGYTLSPDFPLTTGLPLVPSTQPFTISAAPSPISFATIGDIANGIDCGGGGGTVEYHTGTLQSITGIRGTATVTGLSGIPLGLTVTPYTFGNFTELQMEGAIPPGTHFTMTVTLMNTDAFGNTCTWQEQFDVFVVA